MYDCIILGLDSLSILFSHRSFQTPIAISPGFICCGVLERRIAGKNGEVTPSVMVFFPALSTQLNVLYHLYSTGKGGCGFWGSTNDNYNY